MDYTLVYDFIDQGIDKYWLTPFVFIFIGIAISFFSYKFLDKTVSFRQWYIIFGIIITVFCLFFTIIAAPREFKKFNYTQEIYKNKKYNTIEGVIENFSPIIPEKGIKKESFTVNDVHFEYSKFEGGFYGFNHTSIDGGPINKNGQMVRITFYTNDIFLNNRNVILKLEIKNNF